MPANPLPAPPTSLSPRERSAIRMLPFIVGCALFMQMLDSTVVATALPVMATALGSTPVQMNVVITSYLLAVAVFVPISGWAADRFGSKRVFIAAILLFTLSSIGCAASQNLVELVVARVFQGMAGAMMVPVGRIILLRRVPKSELLKAMSFLSLPALLGPIIGPPLGGFLVTYASWHWIFLINIPVGILGIGLVTYYVRDDYPAGAPRLDWVGFILSGISLATLVSGFESLGHQAGGALQSLVLIGTGLACGALYCWHARHTAHPIIDLSLLRVRTFAVATLGGNLCRFAVGASPFLLAILLQVGFGLSPFSAGMITFTGAAGAILMKLVATPIIQFFGFRRILTINALIAAVFISLCGLFRSDTPVWIMVVILVSGGFFRSLQFTAVNTLTYADLGSQEMSRASSFAAMAQQLGISLGVGCAAAVLNLSMRWRGDTHLALPDIIAGFLFIGAVTAASYLSFRRLEPGAGDHIHKNRKVARASPTT
ncbi:MAG TPA: DHA2 family efflux MFS transporter permease subunit [Burkholderiaceae bacterium]|nr:DHA2 family efflux MFS transporter permease subunit [Burkholderiaceae bacterium]